MCASACCVFYCQNDSTWCVSPDLVCHLTWDVCSWITIKYPNPMHALLQQTSGIFVQGTFLCCADAAFGDMFAEARLWNCELPHGSHRTHGGGEAVIGAVHCSDPLWWSGELFETPVWWFDNKSGCFSLIASVCTTLLNRILPSCVMISECCHDTLM